MIIPDEILKRLVFKTRKGMEAEPPVLIEILYDPEPCPDCDRMVENRVVNMKICEYPFRHMRYSCKNCDRYRNPITGEYDCDVQELNRIYRNNAGKICKG